MEAPFFMLPRLAQMPSWGKQLMKHMLTMQGTSSSGGSAEPATQQQSWVCLGWQSLRTYAPLTHPKPGGKYMQEVS
eukprot:s4463_g3.t1